MAYASLGENRLYFADFHILFKIPCRRIFSIYIRPPQLSYLGASNLRNSFPLGLYWLLAQSVWFHADPNKHNFKVVFWDVMRKPNPPSMVKICLQPQKNSERSPPRGLIHKQTESFQMFINSYQGIVVHFSSTLLFLRLRNFPLPAVVFFDTHSTERN